MSLLLKARGITRLSELLIDADKNWEAKGISNIKEIALAMAHGDINFRGVSVLERLPAGAPGQYLKTLGLNNDPLWDDLPGGRVERLAFLTIPQPPAIGLSVAEDHSAGGFTVDEALAVPSPPAIAVNEISVFDQLYESGDDGDFSIEGLLWEGQSFTVNATHDISIIETKCRRVGSPGDIVVAVRATDGSGLPTGPDLTAITFDGNALSTSVSWVTRYIPAYALAPATKYALVIRAPSGDASNYLVWRKDGTVPTYAGGARCYSVDGGGSWSEDVNTDFMFREGEVK